MDDYAKIACCNICLLTDRADCTSCGFNPTTLFRTPDPETWTLIGRKYLYTKTKGPDDMSMIKILVGRCNVGMSNGRVIRYVISRMADGYKTYASLPRAERRALMLDVIKVHGENRDLYTFVISGY